VTPAEVPVDVRMHILAVTVALYAGLATFGMGLGLFIAKVARTLKCLRDQGTPERLS
jgi:hypothetical protein